MLGNNATRFAGAIAFCLACAGTVRADSLFDYNVVVTGTLDTSSHIDGRTFVNNLVTSKQPIFAQNIAAGSSDTLDVAGHLSGSGLTLESGVFRHSSPLPSAFKLKLNGGSSTVTDPSVSIASLSNQMEAIAAQYTSFLATAVTPTGSNLNIAAVGAGVSVFSVSAANLSRKNESIQVNTGNASAVIIKVLGTTFTFGASEHASVIGSSKNVIWYFPDAVKITLKDSLWNGSILAPHALLISPNQDIEGGVYVHCFDQTADVRLPLGNGLTPVFSGPVPVPGPSAALAASFFIMLGFAVNSAKLLKPAL